ncbi:MAG: DUF1565 domain-containing protein [Cyanobacteria bacterium J06592_8]
MPVSQNLKSQDLKLDSQLSQPIRNRLRDRSSLKAFRGRVQQISLLLVALTGFNLCLTPSETLAEPILTQQVAQTPQSPNTPTSVIYVSPTTGNDSGDGSQQSPLRTITQAIRLAQPDTAILLAPGTYSTQTGEQFPLMLPANVTIQGNPNTRGEGIKIYGGDFYTSRTVAKQNIAILGANGSRISGVTITNPNSRGYGLWVESVSMIISNNTFTGNTHDGISVVGSSAPLIQENNFNGNGANGVTVFGSSRPEIRNNEFQNTGFGINVSQNAAPFIAGNRIIYNRDGVVIQANAQPILRNNYIERNERDGIVAIAQALPDLGNANEPGQNVIRGNGRYDVNNGTKTQVIQAYGNQLTLAKTTGSVQVSGSYTASGAPSPIAQQLLTNRADTNSTSNNPSAISPINTNAALPVFVPEESTTPSPRNTRPTRSNSTARRRNPRRTASPSRPRNTPQNTPQTAASRPVPIPVPPPETQRISTPPPVTRSSRVPRRSNSRSRPSTSLLSTLSSPSSNSSEAVSIPVPPPETGQVQASASGVLPVPGSRIPISGEGYTPPGLNTGPSATSSARRPMGSLTAALRRSLQYRVVVEDNRDPVYRRVKSVIPDAFRTEVRGRSVIQAGAFQNRSKANEVIRLLRRNGVRAKLEAYN